MTFSNARLKSGGMIQAENAEGVWFIPADSENSDYVALIESGVTIAPEVAIVPQSLTFAQLLIGLVDEGWITEAEGDAWLLGTIPSAASALIATLPQAQRFAAKARAARPSVVLRNDPLVNALAAAQSKTPEQLDEFFTTYAGV